MSTAAATTEARAAGAVQEDSFVAELYQYLRPDPGSVHSFQASAAALMVVGGGAVRRVFGWGFFGKRTRATSRLAENGVCRRHVSKS